MHDGKVVCYRRDSYRGVDGDVTEPKPGSDIIYNSSVHRLRRTPLQTGGRTVSQMDSEEGRRRCEQGRPRSDGGSTDPDEMQADNKAADDASLDTCR